MLNNFGSVITAMITPMIPKTHEIDYDEATKLAVHLANNGSDGLVLSGTTGEAPATHIDEKRELIIQVKKALETNFPDRKIPLLAGTGSNDTAHAIRNSEVACEAGADGLLVVTPYYSRPTQEGIYQHYINVADATDLPLVLYDVPARSGVKIEHETYKKLAAHKKIVGIKDATGQVYQSSKNIGAMNQVRQSLGGSEAGFCEASLYCGDDSLLLPFLSLGASGIISVASHIVGNQFAKIIDLFNEAKHKEAFAKFLTTIPAIDAVNGRGAQAVDVKAALEMNKIINSRHVRLPNIMANEEAIRRLQSYAINQIPK